MYHMYCKLGILPCVNLSIVSRSKSGAAKPWGGLNGWFIASMYDLSSPM
jgi:hypothetical protein